jgi:hypothetical protein
MSNKCNRCSMPIGSSALDICWACEELDRSDGPLDQQGESEYNEDTGDPLGDGFAMLQADERPCNYEDIWS